MRGSLIILVFTLACWLPLEPAHCQEEDTVFDAVLAGKVCKDNDSSQSLECDYKVGNGLHFAITGLGQPDTGIIFFKSSSDEDYFASFGVLHGCAIVSRGSAGAAKKGQDAGEEYAYVSPKNGKVYHTWEECKEGW